MTIVDATGTVPGVDPDRAGFSLALQTACDQVIQAAGVIVDTVINLVGAVDRAVLAHPVSARRLRVSPRAVKRPLSRYAHKRLRVDRLTYKATISIDIVSTAAISPSLHGLGLWLTRRRWNPMRYLWAGRMLDRELPASRGEGLCRAGADREIR